jgi:O-antigen biosynthesis protein
MMIWFLKHKMLFLNHCFQTFIGRKTWIGYAFYPNQLPQLKQGVFTPSDGLAIMNPLNQPTIQRIDFLYAKDYDVWRDVDIILRNLA